MVRGPVPIGAFLVTAGRVCHPGPTVGYRIETGTASLAYLPDHEPALGARRFPLEPEWTSGLDLARGVDLLLHDAQYTREEYPRHVGWGHSTIHDALAFARLAGVKHLVPFHHDPGRDDAALEAAVEAAVRDVRPEFSGDAGGRGWSVRFGLSVRTPRRSAISRQNRGQHAVSQFDRLLTAEQDVRLEPRRVGGRRRIRIPGGAWLEAQVPGRSLTRLTVAPRQVHKKAR